MLGSGELNMEYMTAADAWQMWDQAAPLSQKSSEVMRLGCTSLQATYARLVQHYTGRWMSTFSVSELTSQIVHLLRGCQHTCSVI